jgi:hypothetical protein
MTDNTSNALKERRNGNYEALGGVKMKELFYIDSQDIAQILTDEAVKTLASKRGKKILDHIFIEKFTETEGITYVSVSDSLTN